MISDDARCMVVERRPLIAALRDVVAMLGPGSRDHPNMGRSVRLAANGDGLVLTACDWSARAWARVAVPVLRPGPVATIIGARDVLGRLRALTGKTVALAMENGELIVRGEAAAVHRVLPTVGEADWPAEPPWPLWDDAGQTVDGAALRAALRCGLAAAARDRTRYAIDDLLLDGAADGLRVVATDARRLVAAPVDRDGLGLGERLLSQSAARAVIGFGRADDRIGLCRSPGWLRFGGRAWTVSAPICENDARSFPRWREVIPPPRFRWAVDRRALISAFDGLARGLGEGETGVRLTLADESVQCSVATATARLPARRLPSGPAAALPAPRYVGLSLLLALDALRTLTGDEVVLDVGKPARPVMLHDARGDAPELPTDGTLWVVTPVLMREPEADADAEAAADAAAA